MGARGARADDDRMLVGIALPLLFVVVWASGYVAGAFGVEVADPLGLLAIRFVLAAVVIVPLALRVPGWRRAPFRRLLVIGVLMQVVQFGFGYTALRMGVHPALSALVLLGLTPLVTTAAGGLLGLERPTARTWGALALGVAGVLVSVAPTLHDASVGAGVALSVLAMLGLAGGTVLQKRWATDVDPRVSVAVQTVTGAAVLVPLAVATGQTHVDPGVQLAGSLVWLAWGGTVAAMALQAILLRRLPVSRVSALLLLVPPTTAVLAWATRGDTLAPLSLAGMPVALLAVALLLRRGAGAQSPVRTAVRSSTTRSTCSRVISGKNGRESPRAAASSATGNWPSR
jgi:drug/metabolite transporter (DMT)-like permease